MSDPLTPDQKCLLEAALQRRGHQLGQRLAEHTQGLTRAERAAEAQLQNAGDVPQRENLRAMDRALSGIESQELAAVRAALRRLQTADYGLCADCDRSIPFERLMIEPWALRCVACESRRERS